MKKILHLIETSTKRELIAYQGVTYNQDFVLIELINPRAAPMRTKFMFGLGKPLEVVNP